MSHSACDRTKLKPEQTSLVYVNLLCFTELGTPRGSVNDLKRNEQKLLFPTILEDQPEEQKRSGCERLRVCVRVFKKRFHVKALVRKIVCV